MKPEINKSSRHSKITGDFSENLVLYMLSKHGFECANIDHTGIDIIARNPQTKELRGTLLKVDLGILVPKDNMLKLLTPI